VIPGSRGQLVCAEARAGVVELHHMEDRSLIHDRDFDEAGVASRKTNAEGEQDNADF